MLKRLSDIYFTDRFVLLELVKLCAATIPNCAELHQIYLLSYKDKFLSCQGVKYKYVSGKYNEFKINAFLLKR